MTWSNSSPFVRVRGGEGQRGVVAAEVRQSRTRLGDGRREGGEVGLADRPAEQRGGDLVGRGVGARGPAPRRGPDSSERHAAAARPSTVDARRPARAGCRRSATRAAGRSAARGRAAQAERDDDGRQELAVGPGQDRPGRRRRPARSASPARAGRSRRTRRARGSAGRSRRARPDGLREPLAVVLDQADGPFDDRARAAIVDLEIDPTQAGQRDRRGRGCAGRRRAASRRSTGRRRRRGRSGWPARPAGAPAGAVPDRRPGPRRRAARGTSTASAPAAPARVRGRRSPAG